MTAAPGPPSPQAEEPSRTATPRIRLTLLGVGAMNSPRFAPAGLLVRCGDAAVAIDGGPRAEPTGALDAWLVTDEHAELRTVLRRLARARDMPAPAVAEHVTGALAVRPFPVEHTSHPAYGYKISAGGQIAVWAPEFWRFPCWADRVGLLFAEAGGWDRPIRFRGGVGGHASVAQVAAEAARRGVRRLVYAHIGRPSLRAMEAGPAVRRMGRRGQNLHCCGLALARRPSEGGTGRIWPPGCSAIHRGQVRVVIARPLPTSGLTQYDVAALRDQAREVICSAHRNLSLAMSAEAVPSAANRSGRTGRDRG